MAVARTEAASLPSIPSPHSSRDKWWDQGVVDVEKDKVLGVDRGWTCVSQVRAESHTAGQGRPGLRLNVWGMAQDSGLGIQWQWKSQTAVQYGNMSELCLASHLSECACVCVGGYLCGLAYVCVCVLWVYANPVFGGIQRWSRASLMLRHTRGRVGGKYDLHCHKGEENS